MGWQKWIDDGLLISIMVQNKRLTIEGVMIWGRMNTTEQWTDPFRFETELLMDEARLKEFAFMFGDSEYSEITYEEFKDNQDYWTPTDRKWKYQINSNRKHV